jgi:tripartite-type tricarboxylate transporter receptor subunit TctC
LSQKQEETRALLRLLSDCACATRGEAADGQSLGGDLVLKLTQFSRRSSLLTLAALIALAPLPAAAKEWRPTKPVKIVVAFAAGGITDIMARLLAEHMQKIWGQTVFVENKTGAGGTIGTMDVVRAAPDGHTLLVGSTGPQGSAYSLFRDMPYQPKDITSIANVFIGSNILLVNNDIPPKTLPEFMEWIKKNDGKLSYASAGVGSLTHLNGLWFFNTVGVKATHVPYRGSAPAMVDLMSGAVPVFFDSLANGMEFARSGKVRALAVTSADRNIYAKELPTIKGATPQLKDFVVDTFYGVFGPANLPKEVIEEVNLTVKEWLALDSSKGHLEKWAVLPAWAPPAETEAYIAKEIAKWRALIEAEGIKLDLK